MISVGKLHVKCSYMGPTIGSFDADRVPWLAWWRRDLSRAANRARLLLLPWSLMSWTGSGTKVAK
jgi:hypothetical protein